MSIAALVFVVGVVAYKLGWSHATKQAALPVPPVVVTYSPDEDIASVLLACRQGNGRIYADVRAWERAARLGLIEWADGRWKLTPKGRLAP